MATRNANSTLEGLCRLFDETVTFGNVLTLRDETERLKLLTGYAKFLRHFFARQWFVVCAPPDATVHAIGRERAEAVLREGVGISLHYFRQMAYGECRRTAAFWAGWESLLEEERRQWSSQWSLAKLYVRYKGKWFLSHTGNALLRERRRYVAGIERAGAVDRVLRRNPLMTLEMLRYLTERFSVQPSLLCASVAEVLEAMALASLQLGGLSEDRAARVLGVTTETLARMRELGSSPSYFRVGAGEVRYWLGDLLRWVRISANLP